MMTEFTPYQSLLGGALIGLSAVLLMLVHGRIMGATGILSGFIMPATASDWLWRTDVLAGMISGPAAYRALTGSFPDIAVPVSTPLLLAGGFIVGIGVTFGSGCTSGHGVCGIARLSPRSIAATLTFMATTFATVFVVRHLLGA
jgi:uncharacterized membrane protein YedE/YeeE